MEQLTAQPSHPMGQSSLGRNRALGALHAADAAPSTELSTQRKCSTRQYAPFFNVGCGILQSARTFQYKAELCLPHGTNW